MQGRASYQRTSQARKKKALKIVTDNKLRGAYGESDLEKGLIRINKKRHFAKGYKRFNPAKDGHEKIYSTLNHELLHFHHPNASERKVRKMEKHSSARISDKRKKQLLAAIK